MKINRSAKCSLKFSNKAKLELLDRILVEYSRVVNQFVDHFWETPTTKAELLKDVVNEPDTWLSARLRKVAAREAIDMILSSKNRDKEKAVKPVHHGNKMTISSTIAELVPAKDSKLFDAWLHIASVGDKIIFDLPIKFHKQFNDLSARGKRLNSYVITRKHVQFVFEIETGPKKNVGRLLGVDTGINTLAALSDDNRFGTDIKACVERVKRCKQKSKGQRRARRALKQRMDEVAKQVVADDVRLIVAEKLHNLNHKTKIRRRLTKNIRRSLGSWAYQYWLDRLQMDCEDRRSSFRSANPYHTSIDCPVCGHSERGNRQGEVFKCRSCGHADNADVNAAKNILNRFLTGPYGAGFKPEVINVYN